MNVNIPREKYLKLYSSCIPVKGAKRSIICDLDRNTFFLIPNVLLELIKTYNNKLVKSIYQSFEDDEHTIIDEYLDFLYTKEMIFFCDEDELELYPQLKLEYVSNTLINNAILDIDPANVYALPKVAVELRDLGCEHLQIRMYKEASISFIREILQNFQNGNLLSINLLIKFSEDLDHAALIDVVFDHQIYSVEIHSTPLDKLEALRSELPKGWNIKYFSSKIESHEHCGIVNSYYFRTNINLLSESISFNSCLNKKVSIDILGNVKNCPSMRESFGNIATANLSQIVESPEFRKKWGINKNQIEVCKDCEFRYVCTDCRAYTENGELFAKPSKCKYDPYSATWSDN